MKDITEAVLTAAECAVNPNPTDTTAKSPLVFRIAYYMMLSRAQAFSEAGWNAAAAGCCQEAEVILQRGKSATQAIRRSA